MIFSYKYAPLSKFLLFELLSLYHRNVNKSSKKQYPHLCVLSFLRVHLSVRQRIRIKCVTILKYKVFNQLDKLEFVDVLLDNITHDSCKASTIYNLYPAHKSFIPFKYTKMCAYNFVGK